MEINKSYIELAEDLYKYLQPHCIAIYLGGSSCIDFIKNKGDVDFICFSNKPIDMCYIRIGIAHYCQIHNLPEFYDFIQIRNKQKEEHAYGSYINKLMIKLVGETINFTFDVIKNNRQEYRQILLDAIYKLEFGIIKNQKRWYQILYGYFILKNNSYQLSDEQKAIINIVHDLKDGWEEYTKGVKKWLICQK